MDAYAYISALRGEAQTLGVTMATSIEGRDWRVAFRTSEGGFTFNIRIDQEAEFYVVDSKHLWTAPAAGQPGVRGPYATLTGAVTVARMDMTIYEEAAALHVLLVESGRFSSPWKYMAQVERDGRGISYDHAHIVRMEKDGWFWVMGASRDWNVPANRLPGARGPYATLTEAVTIARLSTNF